MESYGAEPSTAPAAPDAALDQSAPRLAVPDSGTAPRKERHTGKTQLGRPRRRRRTDKTPRNRLLRLVRCFGVFLVLAGVLCGIAAFRLSRGPISLAAFKGVIEGAVSAELGGNRFDFRDVDLSLGADGLEITLADIRITQPDGSALVQAPRAVAGLSVPAALSGRLGFSRVDLINPRLQVFYTEDGTLSVKFALPAETPAPDAGAETAPSAAGTKGAGSPEAADPINFVEALANISAKARRRENVTAYIREIGLKQATLIVDNGSRKTIWRAPEIKLDLRHKASSSLINGRAVIDGLTGPWSLDFMTVDAAAAQQIIIQANVHDLNPRGLSRQVPALANFENVDVPLDGEARLELTSKGILGAATFALTARPGQILGQNFNLGGPEKHGQIEAGAIKGDYDAAAARVTIASASLMLDHNRLDLTGVAIRAPSPASNGLPLWNYEFASTQGSLAPVTPGGAPVPIDQFNLRGQLIPEAGQLLLQEITLRAGGAAITAKGSVNDLAVDASRSADLTAQVAPMPIAQMLALWPSTLVPEARSWLAAHITKGQLTGGTIKLGSSGDNRLSMAFELAGTEITAARELPPLQIPRALVRLESGGLEVTVPDATIGAGKQPLQLKAVRITAVDTADGTPPIAEVVFRVLGPLATALDLADREPLRLLKSRGVVLHGPEGRLDGQFKLTLPVSAEVRAADIKAEGRLKLTDGHLRQVLGPHDVTGAKLNVDISEAAIDARGDFLLKGIPVKFSGQHFLNSTPDRQSPFRLNFKLDDADRSQLGLDINDLVSGDVPIEILVGPDASGEVQAHLSADLTNAELTIDSVAFRKPSGVPAQVQFDPAKAAGGRTELRNFKIAGRTIAAEGIITLGPDNKAKELSFPEFSLNTVSRLVLQGHLRPDHIWEVRAKGSTFDGRDLFRDLFNVQNQSKPVPKDKPGLDLIADIDTVVGFSDTNLAGLHLTLQKRNDNGDEKIATLDVTAKHEGGKPFEAQIRTTQGGSRKLIATSQDAGQTFKTVGFYPNASGGVMNLEVVLDTRGAIERNGVLKANNFAVFGDAVVSEVFQNGDSNSSQSARNGRKKVYREKIAFDWMVLPFSVGSGQFVMNDAEIRGPLVGARMRGKVDFKSQRMQVGGTYIPLSGLNSALGGLPLLGQLLAGPKGEGMFGFTFVIQGSLANPDVLVNPFSGFVPGILRETQQMAPESFKITPRADPPAKAPVAKSAARASSAGPATAGNGSGTASPAAQPPGVLSDWSSDTTGEPKPRTK